MRGINVWLVYTLHLNPKWVQINRCCHLNLGDPMDVQSINSSKCLRASSSYSKYLQCHYTEQAQPQTLEKPTADTMYWVDGSLFRLLTLAVLWSTSGSDPGCGVIFSDSGCSCYSVHSEFVLDCRHPSAVSLPLASAPVASLTLHNLEGSRGLSETVFPDNTTVRHLYISQSKLNQLHAGAFKKMGDRLESLNIVQGYLTEVPQEALMGLSRLKSLVLDSNLISQIPNHCFYGLLLTSLSLKKNLIEIVAEHAFIGLEESLNDLDLSDNQLKLFPSPALRRLSRLTHINLAWNKISSIPLEESAKLQPLTHLDLSSNLLESISKFTFRSTPSLISLSLNRNKIAEIERGSFLNLKQLHTLNLRSNRLMEINSDIFQTNEYLSVVDLSYNHLHSIQDLFIYNSRLRELYLGGNNILEISADTFSNNTFLSVLDLQGNAIRNIHNNAFSMLKMLTHLCLSENFLTHISPLLLIKNTKLLSVNLEGNLIQNIEAGTFFSLNRLKELNMQNNALVKIWRSTLYPLPNLLELNLANNLIDNINPGAFLSLGKLESLDLQGNFMSSLEGLFLQSSDGDTGLNSSEISRVQCLRLNNNRFNKLSSSLFGDMSLVRKVYLTNNSISNIEDYTFESFKAMMLLDLSFNQIRFITIKTFSSLYNLEELYLSKNDIKHIEARAFTGLKRLRILDLSNNEIVVLHKDIFQQGLPIRILNLKNCSLAKVDKGTFRGMTNLNELNLEHNMLDGDSLSVFDIPGLRRLRLGNNNLTIINNVTFKRLPSLQLLTLENNGIKNVPSDAFVYNQRIYFLSLSRNWIKSFPKVTLTVLTNLRELRLNQNEFSHIPYDALSGLNHLETLVLSENMIRSFDASKFSGLRKLRNLQLQRNFISALTGFSSVQWPHLVSIDLSRNALSALPVNFFHLAMSVRIVDLSFNRFGQIPSVALSEQNLPHLTQLNLGTNPLTSLNQHSSFRLHPSLQELHITGTNLTTITDSDFLAFPSLLHLILAGNTIFRIGDGTFETLPNLVSLDLSRNQIGSFPTIFIQNLKNLQYLNLSSNRMKDVEEFTEGSSCLKILDLSFNHVMRIGKSSFKNLKSLTELHLQGNWLSYIAPEALKYQTNLQVLQLNRNYFDDLPLKVFRSVEPRLNTLATEGNPLQCGCDQQELWYWLQDHQKLVDRGPRCEDPPQLRGLWFLGLEPPEFCSLPLVSKLTLGKIQASSLAISWDSQPKSGVTSFTVAYHTLEAPTEVIRLSADKETRSLVLEDLSEDTWYLVCVLGLGRWSDPPLHNSRTSRCTQVRTLERVEVREAGVIVFSRRLGLMVGCGMGFVVFLLLICVLGYIKVETITDRLIDDGRVVKVPVYTQR
ncbi:hypothetical protein J6590_002172 [Homalodisca vitripennis]|nr:hypothetical protein J6590_002172 [Homalodisca vitripennis]